METSASELEQVVQLFKVLSDRNRLKILLFLQTGEKNVTTIAQEMDMEQSAVSHQLRLLRDKHIVKTRREGKAILYSLDDHHVVEVLTKTFEHVHHQSSFF